MKKINSFNVIEKRKDQYILQEEENKIFLFFKKNRNFITFSLFLFVICILLVIVGVSVSLFRGSNDYDITYIVGDEEVDVNNDPDIGDEEVEDELLGEIAREDGVVLLVETVMSSNGDVISYNGWFSSDFIRVHKGEKYYIYNEKHREPFAGLYSYYYNVNKNKIERLNLGDVELVGIKEFVSKYDGEVRL